MEQLAAGMSTLTEVPDLLLKAKAAIEDTFAEPIPQAAVANMQVPPTLAAGSSGFLQDVPVNFDACGTLDHGVPNLRKWAARKTVPGPGPGAGGEEGCGRGAGVFIKARNAHPRPGSRLPRRRARGFSHISAFSRSTRAFAHSKEEGGGRATVSRQRGL